MNLNSTFNEVFTLKMSDTVTWQCYIAYQTIARNLWIQDNLDFQIKDEVEYIINNFEI